MVVAAVDGEEYCRKKYCSRRWPDSATSEREEVEQTGLEADNPRAAGREERTTPHLDTLR